MSTSRPERILAGQVASPGLVAGHIRLAGRRAAASVQAAEPGEERRRFVAALALATEELGRLLEREQDQAASGILEFQLALIEDAELIEPVQEAIASGSAAAAAWSNVLGRQIADYETAEDEYFRGRATDLADLRERVIDALAGPRGDEAEAIEGAILVAEDLGPSRFLELDWRRYRGGALTGGSVSGHVAILARARGVPLIVGLELGPDTLIGGTEAILDAEEGRLILDPVGRTRDRFAKRLAERRSKAAADARFLARPALTRAGAAVAVAINVDEPGILDRIDPAHCDGIGLARTEFLFAHGGELPGEDAQFAVYSRLIEWANGRPVTIRTLDAGGDKPIPGLTPEGESNPFLGLRGIRLSLARPDVLRIQLRALARAAALGPLKVMLPMVTVPRELEETKAMLAESVAELGRGGLPAAMPRLGMMVEVPAAAIAIDRFSAEFFSIGSNDLVQYVTATGRDCASVAALHDPLNPAVLELIGRVVAHGRATGIDVSLCGDMASDSRYLPALLDLGLASLSVAPARLAAVKAEIARHG